MSTCSARAVCRSPPPPTHPLLHPLPLCQAYFLLYYKEEDAFWILCALVDIVLPPDYFTQSLLGRSYAPALPKEIAMSILGGLLEGPHGSDCGPLFLLLFCIGFAGVRAECMLMKCLVFQRLPKLHAHFAALGVDVYNVALKWLMVRAASPPHSQRARHCCDCGLIV